MGTCSKRVILTFCALLAVHVAVAAAGLTAGQELAFYAAESGCKGTIGECLLAYSGGGWDEDGSEELGMESETARRMLAGVGRYISYGALRRNSVPCSRRGASYYNCRPGAHANPYRRGCSRITRCRR
ncbi:protein RALF-like 33 [Punica granatum]|uniref:Uncharacterized protein n=2 Tax=Punica granatum TaxID=22663 RepID=A0A218WEJ5_PUNGR|nr:protein RALF-like 33 [Punica granatum]OWM71245.1 hypothetical protein CDL15_Pgr011372 [Punica granatum]PKI65108.1 hypothetical protein CRG98_014577 [Punica granatum]